MSRRAGGEEGKSMQYILMAVFAALVLAADQITKLLTVANIQLGGTVEAIPGLFSLTYVRNTGAAWSAFEGQHWLFALVFAAFAAFIIWEFPKKRLGFKSFERWWILWIFRYSMWRIASFPAGASC